MLDTPTRRIYMVYALALLSIGHGSASGRLNAILNLLAGRREQQDPKRNQRVVFYGHGAAVLVCFSSPPSFRFCLLPSRWYRRRLLDGRCFLLYSVIPLAFVTGGFCPVLLFLSLSGRCCCRCCCAETTHPPRPQKRCAGHRGERFGTQQTRRVT